METDGVTVEVPYVVSTHCPGEQASRVFKTLEPHQKVQLAQRLGQLVSRFHLSQESISGNTADVETAAALCIHEGKPAVSSRLSEPA